MKVTPSALLLAAVVATTVSAHATSAKQSQTILVESPSDLPELAQRGGEAMYLQNTGDGQAILYIEINQGKKLSILDVTDPARVKGVAQTTIDAPAPFDFVKNVGDSAVLIRYRDQSGFALLNFHRYDHPILVQAPQLGMANVEELGHTGLLLTGAMNKELDSPVPAQSYGILDTSKPSHVVARATIDGVVQRLSREETGSLFLLTDKGVTIVRRPRVEEDYKIQQMQLEGN
jgi:hypothetical protein